MSRYLALLAAVLLVGCAMPGLSTGGSSTGAVTHAIGLGTAPYVVLDLTARTLTYRLSIPDVASNPAYRDNLIAFRRVGHGTAQALVGVFELTQGQWVRIDPIASTPWTAVPTAIVPASATGPSYPAFNLRADDLSTALAAFTIPGGSRLAIPSAAQWASAVGAEQGYSWGGTADRAHLVDQAVVRETVLAGARLASGTSQIDAGGPSTVGSRSPSAAGLYDLHGNVWEWVDGGTGIRGGSWYDPASLARVDAVVNHVQGVAPDVDHALIGARLVLIP